MWGSDRVMIPLVGLALFSASLRAEEDRAPEQNPFYIKGINALKDHLRSGYQALKASLGDFKDNPQALTRIHIKLAETLILAACRNTSATLRSLPPPLLIIWPNT